MKKSYLFVFALLFVAMFMVGCGETNVSAIISTTSGAYQFYSDSLLPAQNELLVEISQTGFSDDSDRARANTIVNNIGVLSREESVVLASIECFNLVSESTKQIVVDCSEGVLNVRGVSGNTFECTLVGEDGVTLGVYQLRVSRNNNSYSVEYNNTAREQSQFVAIVNFNQQTSFLSLDITSTDTEGQTTKVTKSFYSLANSQKALQVEISINSYCYGARYFSTADDCNLKLSKKQNTGESISTEELTLENFCNRGNDVCGYIISGKPLDEVSYDGQGNEVASTVRNSYTYFGVLSEW